MINSNAESFNYPTDGIKLFFQYSNDISNWTHQSSFDYAAIKLRSYLDRWGDKSTSLATDKWLGCCDTEGLSSFAEPVFVEQPVVFSSSGILPTNLKNRSNENPKSRRGSCMNNFPQLNSYGDCNTNKTSVVQLPSHLDRLLDLPWNSQSSTQIDRWFDYCDREGLQSAQGVQL